MSKLQQLLLHLYLTFLHLRNFVQKKTVQNNTVENKKYKRRTKHMVKKRRTSLKNSVLNNLRLKWKSKL